MQLLALHGVPIGKETWKNITLPLQCHRFRGLATPELRSDWSLDSFVKEVLPLINSETVLIGHDLGGVVAAICATKCSPRAIILTGTTLGNWWLLTRLTAIPVLRRFFYHTFGGKLFIKYGHSSSKDSLPSPPKFNDWATRMRTVAQNMKPPANLVDNITCPMYLIWGTKDKWYPPFLAKRLSKQAKAPLYWVNGGHYSMLEQADEFQAALTDILTEIA
jgi:pimeloyl-ACP methyl ester carboxylesterase